MKLPEVFISHRNLEKTLTEGFTGVAEVPWKPQVHVANQGEGSVNVTHAGGRGVGGSLRSVT